MGARNAKPVEPVNTDIKQTGTEGGQEGGTTGRRRRNTKNTVTADAQNGTTGTGVGEIRILDEDGTDTAPTIPKMDSVAKPKRKPAKRKKQPKLTVADDPLVKEMISGLVHTVFGLIAFRAGEHWALTAEEANKITEPTIRIMDRFNVLDKVAASSDFIALGLAATAVFTPRVVYSVQLHNHNKKLKEMGLSRVQPVQQEQRGSANEPYAETGSIPVEDRSPTGVGAESLQHNVKQSIESGIVQH